jgi:hypothetical protein
LNRHSILYGNNPAKNDGSRLTRGQRVFCSDRGRRGGCGKTFSIFLADVLPRHTVSASALGKLLLQLLANACIRAAIQRLRLPFPLETIYHLLQRLRRRLPEIRCQLCRRQKAPDSLQPDPLGHTVEHLQSVFPESLCPVGDFQLSFQQPFLSA